MAKSHVKSYGPNAGRVRPKRMGMGSGKALIKAKSPKRKQK